MGDGIRAFTPWEEIAYMLAGTEGYARVQASDKQRVAPGADTIQELFGADPTLIVLDELGEYLRKASRLAGGQGQLTSFLEALLSAVQAARDAALVFTLALRSDGGSRDAFSEEDRRLGLAFDELTSVSGRKATNLNPTRDDETAALLRRRLFSRIDPDAAHRAAVAYGELWTRYREKLSEDGRRVDAGDFEQAYPFHPDVLATLTCKTATMAELQRVRGMLRILGRTAQELCRVLPIAPSTDHEHAARRLGPGRLPPRARRDARLSVEIRRVFNENFGVYGVREVWRQMLREGFEIARRAVSRLTRSMGLSGAVRGKRIRTTVPDPAAPCPRDRVNRVFRAPAPNMLWLSDFTYVATWGGFVSVAFVIDAFARRIVGWRVSRVATAEFVLDALDQALHQRHPFDGGRLVCHSDRGSQ